ncbi:MAG: hypothetical protein R6W74_03335 [Nitrosomonas halophila]
MPGQFAHRFGSYGDRAAEKYLDGHGPLGIAKMMVEIADDHCFLPSLRAQRSNPAG